jgi:hypothetical protein
MPTALNGIMVALNLAAVLTKSVLEGQNSGYFEKRKPSE